MIQIHRFVFNPFEENTYLLVDSDTNQAAVVDPGMFTQDDLRVFDDFIAKHNITLKQVINTHMHVDHCFADNYVCDKYNITVAANTGDDYFAASPETQARRFGIQLHLNAITITTGLKDGDAIAIGNSSLTVLHVPGHSQGGIALYSSEDGFVLSGDSLFRGSIGRTDLRGGDHAQLINAIHAKLLTLPEGTVVLPGHGPATTIGDEKARNPYL